MILMHRMHSDVVTSNVWLYKVLLEYMSVPFHFRISQNILVFPAQIDMDVRKVFELWTETIAARIPVLFWVTFVSG